MLMLISQAFLKGWQIPPNKIDDDYAYICGEFALNYSVDAMRYTYLEAKEKAKNEVDADKLRELGYTEEQIAKTKIK